jgi:hypothetical protein
VASAISSLLLKLTPSMPGPPGVQRSDEQTSSTLPSHQHATPARHPTKHPCSDGYNTNTNNRTAVAQTHCYAGSNPGFVGTGFDVLTSEGRA